MTSVFICQELTCGKPVGKPLIFCGKTMWKTHFGVSKVKPQLTPVWGFKSETSIKPLITNNNKVG